MQRLITSILLLASITTWGQTFNVAKLDSFLSALANQDLAMGSLAISKNGKILYQRAIGYALIDAGKKIPADIHTKYRIGSTSKMFTAVMIFQLMEEGKLNLNQKLEQYFPDLPNANKITISNLLNHRSGLHDYTHDTNFPDWMDKPKTHEEMLEIIKEKGSDFEPGTQVDYSNSNYLLLSYIIEHICSMPYEQALKQRITKKIGLTDTYFGQPIDYSRNESTSYKYGDKTWKKEKETDLSIHSGAGSLVSTPTDLVKFMEALFTGKLIKKSSLEKMQTIVDGYGMGMFPFDHGTIKGFGHNGRIEEFYSALRYFPGDQLSFAYCTNGIDYPRIDIIEGILKICYNETFIIPFSRKTILDSNELNKLTGMYATDQRSIIVTVTKEGLKIFAETKGKRFELEEVAKNYFMHSSTGYFFDFHPEKNELLIKETDNTYYLKRDR
ncbi:serine hydrolase domain-containing protein [Flavihumibacter profundi]|jgi:D-alanyl-D-alanine carboxypeptidase|uniref:serine hydrolase domain-containing protein n=1 Tax=Flavihumibacter profundi TaxID=2716883 RepID=UPI001CC4129C|nr:serine hydrolase domain-containing protein [Flavihumibacter profundi]MBZ5855537.1 beta-lactamase family protein [Flavihumibacter profundi]